MKLKLSVLIFFFCAIISTTNASGITIPTTGQTPQRQQNSNVIDTILIAKWLNNATSAFTFTWDDNNFSHPQIAEILETYDFRGSFFVNPGFANWNDIKELYGTMASNGHEIGNHTWSHLNLTSLTMESLLFQINEPIDEITDATGVYPVSFVQPFNASNPTVDSVIFINHLFARIRSHYPMDNRMRRSPISHHTITDFGNWINESVENNKWLIIGAHGIDGAGWEPITSELLHQTCQLLEENQPEIWVGTLKEIAAYEYLKEEISIDYHVENDALTIDFEGFDEEKYANMDSLPVTILIEVEKCNKLVPYNNPDINITKPPMGSSDFKQFTVTFDLKLTQSIHLLIASETSVFSLSGENGYCEGESGVTLKLEGSESGTNYYLVRNETDTLTFLPGDDNALFFENVITEGIYQIIANDPETGCWTPMQNSIPVNKYPLPYLSIPENFEVCEGEEVILSAGYDHGTLYWSDEIDNEVPFIINQTQTFSAVVVSDFGCIPALGSVTVTVNPLPFLQIPAHFEVCEGDTTILNAHYDHGTLSWNHGITNNEPFPIVESGFYKATVSSGHGCGEATDSVFILVNALPEVNLNAFEDLCKGDYDFTLSGGKPLGGVYFIDGKEAVDFIPENTGQYEILYQYTDSHGCAGSAYGYLAVVDCTTSIDHSSEKIRIYPNPARDILNIEVPFKASAVLINSNGINIKHFKLNAGVNTVDISQLRDGVYFLTLIGADQHWNTKFQKQ